MSDWEGTDRRKNDHREDHDVLTRIDVNLSNFMRRFEDHTKEDIECFKTEDAKLEKISGRLWTVEKWMWVAIGGFSVLEFILKYWK